MKGKLLFGVGIAAGYVLGSRSGRAAYEKLKTRATAVWESQPVQDKVAAATDVVKEKAPEVSEQLGEAARRAGTVIGSAVRRDSSSQGAASERTDDGGAQAAAGAGGIPAHSTHPETVNLGTDTAATPTPDVGPDKS
ncbi:MAG: YtxH domain-containing protein [Arthrobacter sp.]